jgi:hypothetical protein
MLVFAIPVSLAPQACQRFDCWRRDGVRGALAYWVQDNAATAGRQVVVTQQLGQAIKLVPCTAASLSKQATACRWARSIEPMPRASELGVQRRRESPQPHEEPVSFGADLVARVDGQVKV